MGQDKPVHVYRLVASGTMENRIYSNQLRKQGLFLRVVDEQNVSRSVNGRSGTKDFEYDSADDIKSSTGSEADDDEEAAKDRPASKRKAKKGARKRRKDAKREPDKKEELSEDAKIALNNEKQAKLFADDDVVVIADSDQEEPTAAPNSQLSNGDVGPDWFAYEVWQSIWRMHCPFIVTGRRAGGAVAFESGDSVCQESA